MEEAEAKLAEANRIEQDLELELEKLYRKAAHLCQSESRNLAYAGEQHKQVPAAIKRLQETLKQTSGVAAELSNRVRKLDTVCNRVSEALKIVDDMLELRECSDQVMKAIQHEEYEQAARYVARFRSSQDALPPGTDEASVRVMREAEQQLGAVVRQRFEAAMAAKDKANVSKFAKLFHPLGLAGEGVKKYIEFIRRSIAEKCSSQFRQLAPSFGKLADSDESPYAQALEEVFLAVADVVGEHQEMAEKEFGLDNFIVVVRGLLEEADTQGLKVIEKFWKDNTQVFDSRSGGGKDVREVDMVLDTAARLTALCQDFHTYIHKVAREVVELITDKEAFLKSLPEDHSKEDGLVHLSKLTHRVQELVSAYVQVEQHFLLQSVGKAIKETDSLDPFDADQLTTTLVDDAFFVLQQSLFRAMKTFELNAVCAVVNYVNSAISGEIKDGLVMNLSESKRLYSNWVTYPKNIQKAAPGEHPLAALFRDQEGKLLSPLTAANSWPHSLNNLQQCIEYMEKLKEATQEEFEEKFPAEAPSSDKHALFEHCLAALDATKTELESEHAKQCREGFSMLKIHLKQRLDPLKMVEYNIDEGQYADYQVNDPFAKAFNAQAAVIHQHVKQVLNPVSCDEVMQQMAEQTCRGIETRILSKKFSLFGALQFESDIRAVCAFFTDVSEQALRHKFVRLREMSELLNLESIEELHALLGEVRTWRLTREEMRTLVQARVDFLITEADLNQMLPL